MTRKGINSLTQQPFRQERVFFYSSLWDCVTQLDQTVFILINTFSTCISAIGIFQCSSQCIFKFYFFGGEVSKTFLRFYTYVFSSHFAYRIEVIVSCLVFSSFINDLIASYPVKSPLHHLSLCFFLFDCKIQTTVL